MNRQNHYCGLQGLTLSDFLRGVSDVRRWHYGNTRHLYYTHKGRCGLGLLCKHWKLKAGDEVLMPAYNCGTEVDPFVSYKLKVNFYRIDKNAQIDSKDLMKRVSEKTKVIYVIHYFGYPQDIKVLSEYCRKNSMYLIEDCALSLFGTTIEYPIGILGDAAIYSFPKTLPVPDGGILTISRGLLSEVPTQKPPMGEIFSECLPLLKRMVLRFCDMIGVYPYLPKRLIQSRRCSPPSTTRAGLPEIPQSYYYDKNIQNMTVSAMTRYIVKHTCSESVVQRRRANYTLLYEAMKDSAFLKPLYNELPEGACPLYLPLLVEDRKTACDYLNHKGISAIQWWAGFHQAFDWVDFPDARYLKEHILAIPIHQQLDQRNIDYISSSLKLSNGEW